VPSRLDPPADLLDRLASHRTLSGAPREELAWLIDHGALTRYEPGESPWGDQPIDTLGVVLAGKMAIFISRGSGRRKFMEWVGGDISGVLPYSRLGRPPGEGVIDSAVEMLEIHRDHFPDLIRECPVVTAKLVHVMLDRARHFTSTDLQDEKMVALGRLAAGLAHELNNPSAAAARTAKLLGETLAEGDAAAQAIGAADLTDAQRSLLIQMRNRPVISRDTGSFSTLALADEEEAIADWLTAHGADPDSAEALAESGISIGELEAFARALPADILRESLVWIATGQRGRALAMEVERATKRIHDLVSAVKRFTYMDRATVAEPFDVVQGISDTLRLVNSKARAKSVAVESDLPEGLPKVRAYGGELNQVWHNLVENAIDAVHPGGRVKVSATHERGCVVVRVLDDGPGIPPDIRERIFEPFFTTKEPGEGTGLGLDISLRLIRRHDAEIDVDSRPGRTEFKVSLPVFDPAS
jgi:signal transduction histidine kinase